MDQGWAKSMKKLLLELNKLTTENGGVLPMALQESARKKYKRIVAKGFKSTGGPIIERPPGEIKTGPIKKTKPRNLVERLRKFKDDVLRFTTDEMVPYSNNDSERPIRMIKVHMKISGCFKSLDYAQGFCTMRGYLVTCMKNGINAYEAITMAVKNEVPAFITERLGKDKAG
jgi:transposase